MPKPSAIVCASHSFRDPLFQGLMYQYLLGVLKECPDYQFHLFTEEQAAYQLAAEEQASTQAELRKMGIHWHPIRYRNGRFLLLKKLWNFIAMFWTMLRIRLKYRPRLIIGYLAIAGGYAYIASIFLRLRLMVFCFEPHSQYMADFGIWNRNSLKYKILNKIERRQATRANYVTAPTNHTVRLLESWNSKARIFRVPISVDTDKFVFRAADRERIRRQLQADQRYVLMYLGKFNGIYYSEQEIARFFKQLLDFQPDFFFFTITPDDTQQIRAAYLAAGLQESDFAVWDKIPYSEIEGYISACDIGLVAIPPLDSQKYRTPVKIGNYLACGLPFIINKGVADDDELAEKEGVGVVLDDLSPEAVERALPAFLHYKQQDRDQQRERCRRVAIEHRGIQNSVAALRFALEESVAR